MQQGLIRNLGDVEPRPVEMDGVSGVRMALMVGRTDGAPHFSLRQFLVEPGGHTPRHSHDYEHEVYVVEGGGTVLLNGEELTIRAGDVIYIPADHEHQFRATSDASLRFLCLVPVERNCGGITPGS
jgi:quercetin dioxygenase-like cupin family protein